MRSARGAVMREDRSLLAEAYSSALADYLGESGEAALSRAYELGRLALCQGLGVLDVAAIYRDALSVVVHAAGAEPRRFSQAAEFFFESLAPFEMTLRGYWDANDRLKTLNHTLARQNVELVNAKQSAEAARRELESFSYSVAHDLRAPLRHVDGFSQVLLEDSSANLDEKARDSLRRVRAAAQRMAELIDDLLQLSRVGRAEFRREPVDLSDLAGAVARDLEGTESRRHVRCTVEDGLMADGDVRLLRMVFENLLGNAWKFTSRVTEAAVEVGRVRSEIEPAFFVRDNGAGFDSAYADRLFRPFQRLHSETEFPGTGIGLATVQRIIQRHGGRIWAEGEVGAGATVYFTIPPIDLL
jgi:light-regulated signal transduction histidine kinase (bacteriophytochrome)